MKTSLLLAKMELKKSVNSNRLWVIITINLFVVVFAYFKVLKVHNRITFDFLLNSLLMLNGINLLFINANLVWEDFSQGIFKLLKTSNVKIKEYILGKTFFVVFVNLALLFMVSVLIFPLNLGHFLYYLSNLLFLLFYLFLISFPATLFLLLLSLYLPNYSNSLVYFLLIFGSVFLEELTSGLWNKVARYFSMALPNLFKVGYKLKEFILYGKVNYYLVLYCLLLAFAYFVFLLFALKKRRVI